MIPFFISERRLPFFVGLLLGVAVWATSPVITGKIEPWDADSAYYAASLFLFGIIGATIFPKIWVIFLFALFLGQTIYVVFLALIRSGPFPLGFAIVCLLVWITISICGAIFAKGLVWCFRGARSRNDVTD